MEASSVTLSYRYLRILELEVEVGDWKITCSAIDAETILFSLDDYYTRIPVSSNKLTSSNPQHITPFNDFKVLLRLAENSRSITALKV
jgi:hypothetical protein